MAIHVDRTIKELEKMVGDLGIGKYVKPTGKNGRYMKEDYIIPIRKYFLAKRYKKPENVPDHLKLVLKLKSPMLARRIDDGIPEEIQKAIWESREWYLEEKLNGSRMLIVKDNSGMHIYSRHNSDVDLLPINYTEKILFPDNFDLGKIKDNFIIDTEITSDFKRLNTIFNSYGVTTETELQAVTALLSSDVERAIAIQKNENLILTFNSFDCLYYNGGWLLNEPLRNRRRLALELWEKLHEAGFKIKPVRSNISNKRMFHKSIIMSGGEGTIAKSIDGIYIADTNRPKDGWIKIKRSMSQYAEDLGYDTIDGWVSGFEPATKGKNREGLIGNILVSVYLKKYDGSVAEHVIAKISGIDMKLREDMTEIIDGEPYLKPSYYGRVVEIDGAGVSARAKRLNHAVLLGFRYDKNKDSCIINEEFLDKMIL